MKLSTLVWGFYALIEALQGEAGSIKRVAIIGAGSGGTSTAYYLRQFAKDAGIDVVTTLFERNSYIGGRSTTVLAYNSTVPIELGASIFVKVNKNLVDAATAFNLSVKDAFERPGEAEESLGVWNGETFVFTQKESDSDWWNNAKLILRYGLSPIRTNNLMKKVVGKFLTMYDENFPFASLSQAVIDTGLDAAMTSNGKDFLTANGISEAFSNDLIQASTRVNYAQNLGLIHGLETMVCMAATGAMSVQGGNWRIFAGMAEHSQAKIRLNTSVTSVTRKENEYEVEFSGSKELFDAVVLAGPKQFADIEFGDLPAIEEIPYVSLHVTLFTSPYKLSGAYFNLPPGKAAPETILTTLHPGDTDLSNSPKGVGRAGFFSISTLRTATNPNSNGGPQEYIYKIFSPREMTTADIGAFLGIDEDDITENVTPGAITWIYRKVWNSYPYEYPRVTFEEPNLDGHHLWYTSGIESFISTMETSSLMGKNVARLMVDKFLGRSSKKSHKSDL